MTKRMRRFLRVLAPHLPMPVVVWLEQSGVRIQFERRLVYGIVRVMCETV